MNLGKHRSVPRLPVLYENFRPKRALSSQLARQLPPEPKIQKYNPFTDPQLQIYLGKKRIKNKLEEMGYVFNPENKLVRKQSMKNRKLPRIYSKSESLKPRDKIALETISKVQFDEYIVSIKKRLGFG